MILNKLYEYPTSTRAAINSLRHYSINGSNAKLPSVTTILSQTQSEDKAMSLQRWRDRVGAAEAAKITNDAATRGTAMHMYLEKHCLNEGYLDLTPTGTQA